MFGRLIAQMDAIAPPGMLVIPQDAPDPNAERLKDWHEAFKAAARRGLIEIGLQTPPFGRIEVVPPADLRGATFDPSGFVAICVTDGRPIVRPAKWRWRIPRSPMSVSAARRAIVSIWAAEEEAGRKRPGRDRLVALLNAMGKSISKDRVQEALATMPPKYRRGRGRPKRVTGG